MRFLELINTNVLNSLASYFKRPEAALTPPAPGEPVPSVPPVEIADGSPLRYGGLRTAFRAAHKMVVFQYVHFRLAWSLGPSEACGCPRRTLVSG